MKNKCFTGNDILDYLFWAMVDIKINQKTKNFDLYLENRLIGIVKTKQSGKDWDYVSLEIDRDLDTLFCLDEMEHFIIQIIKNRGLADGMTTIYNSSLGAKSGDLAGFSS